MNEVGKSTLSCTRPDPKSERTRQRAIALTFLRGCETWNPCWDNCYEAAFATITEYGMDEWEREHIGEVMAEVYGHQPPKCANCGKTMIAQQAGGVFLCPDYPHGGRASKSTTGTPQS